MYSISEIIKRYNDGVSDYAAYKVAVNEHQTEAQSQHLRNAGEELSQALEHSVKYMVETLEPTTFPQYARKPTPEVIKDFFLNGAGVQQRFYSATVEPGLVPTVDFNYLRTHKNELTNNAKHSGGTVDTTVVEEYIKQIKLFITQYLDKNALLRDIAYFMSAQQDQIQQFYVACDHFQREGRTYILLTNYLPDVDIRHYQHFSLAPWDIIVDFHRDSSTIGFSAGAYHGGADVAHIYKTSDLVTVEDFASHMRRPFYFYANGFRGERSYTDYEDWNRSYYNKLDRFFEAISQCVVTQKSIVVSLLSDEDYTQNLRSMINRHFPEVKFVIANDASDVLLNLAQRKVNQFTHLHTSVEDMDACFSEYLTSIEDISTEADIYRVPYIKDEGNGLLTKTELEDLEECFEVVYNGIGDGTDEMGEPFLRGEVALTWQGAKRQFAAKRDRFQRMYVKPLETEIKKARSKVLIMHEPGYGGTTVARQLAYTFHDTYPVLILKEYRAKAVVQKLEWLHDRTKKTLVVFMEIPSVISLDDFEYLYSSTNQSRPYIFVGIMRGQPGANDISVTDWGNDSVLLADKYRPIIEERYIGTEKVAKLDEVQHILAGDVEAYKRTPFYFGMLSYEKDFVAANGFFEKFVKAVEGKEMQRKFLIYLSLCDVYANKALPETFFKMVFGEQKNNYFKLERYFDEGDGILESLIQTETVGNVRFIRPKYTFFSRTLLTKLLRKERTPVDTGWTENLGTYCKEFILDAARSAVAVHLEEEVLQPLFIGSSKERDGDKFTDLVEEIHQEERINIFLTLQEQFPENPHFCSHLARYYAREERNMQFALDYADRAIRLSLTPDPLLHHMKGMCLYYIINNRIDAVKKLIKTGQQPDEAELEYITETLLSQAESEFQKSREIQQRAHHEDEYGYIPNIKLLIHIFDFYVQVNQETKRNVISTAKQPYIIWLDKAHSLLDNAARLHDEGAESSFFLDCETQLWSEYENYSDLIEKLNNQLVKTQHPALVRRQIAQLYIRRDNDYKTSPKANERILNLMNDNMKTDAKNITNFLLWFRAARYSELSIDEILSRLTQWNSANPAIDLTFYCYVFNVLKAMDGSSEAVVLAKKYMQECGTMGGYNRIKIREWYGNAPQGIVSCYERRENPDDYELYEVTGYVKEYQHPGNAVIELDCGLDVFFKPSVKGITESSLNHNVKFLLGFSYDGLRADNDSVEIIG